MLHSKSGFAGAYCGWLSSHWETLHQHSPYCILCLWINLTLQITQNTSSRCLVAQERQLSLVTLEYVSSSKYVISISAISMCSSSKQN